MRDRFLARLWRWAALMAVMAVGVISLQSGQLSAQQPPPNNPATGTPTIIGALRVGEVARVDTSSIADPDGLTNPIFSYTWYAGLHFDCQPGVAPPDLSGSLGDPGELDLSWSTPAVCDFTVVFDCWLDLDRTFSVGDGGSEISGYTVQWKLASGSWGVVSHLSEAEVTTTSHTLTGLSTSSTYTARVLARNAVGAGTPSTEVTVSGTNLNVGPVVSGKAMPSFFETNRRTVETYTATDPENDTITWSLSGPDASFFSIADGELNVDGRRRDRLRRNGRDAVGLHGVDGAHART